MGGCRRRRRRVGPSRTKSVHARARVRARMRARTLLQAFFFSHSFIFSVEYSDPKRSFYRDLGDIAPSLDFGSYPDSHPLFSENLDRYDWLKRLQKKNKGVLGKMKDEAGSLYISEAVCLR